MSRTISTLRFSVFAFLWTCLAAALPAQVSPPPTTIGHLDSKDALLFQGNQSYTKEQICEALYRDKDVIVSISPMAPLSGFLKMLETKIRLGYLNDGFHDPQVEASYVGQPEHILISIVEGPRYTKGPLVIHGASDALKDELIHCLNNIDPRVAEATGILDVTKSIQKGDMNAALNKDIYMALLWGIPKPPSFAPSFVKTSTQYLHNLLKVLGYYHSEFTLKLVPDHAARTVGLHIAFQNEGTRPHIGTIHLSGNKINSDEQVLTYLGVKTGQPLDGVLTQTLQSKLINSGRFRSVKVNAEVNIANPPQSTLNIMLEETTPATPLGGELTEKEALMQKVGQFMNRYQSWEKDVWFRLDFPGLKDLVELGQKYGFPIPVIEGVYSSQKGVILSEIIDQTQTLNTFVISPEQIRYLSPPLNQNILCTEPRGNVLVQISVSPDSTEKKDGWSIQIGMGVSSGSTCEPFSYQPTINIHPASWFHSANDPETQITFVDDMRALVETKETEIEVDRRTGEIIEMRSGIAILQFQKGAFDEHIQKLEKRVREKKYPLTTTHNNGAVIWSSLLPLYLTHAPGITLTADQKTQAADAWWRMISGFDECGDSEDQTSALPEKEFPLPVDASLAESGMMPMILSMIYQSCHDNLPRDSWVRTLSHVSVLMVSGYAQCPSVSQELQQLYNSDQIGPIGYLLTARVLAQFGFPAYGAFAQRGLQVMTAEDFRKDWKPLLVKDSKIKEMIRCLLEKFQTHSDEDIRMLTSVFPPEVTLLMERVAKGLKETKTEQLHESLDPVLTDYWEKTGKEQISQQLNNVITPQNKVVSDGDREQETPAGGDRSQ